MTFNGTKLPLTRFRSLGLFAMASAAGLLSGCLDRPVGHTKPETNNIFVKQNPSGGIDKIDILFMIDNSLSMGDKQAVLAAAVPQLLRRLTNPDCVSEPDPTTGAITRDSTAADPTVNCLAGLQREFAPVKDIHIGVVTSSLGDFGGDVCPETAAESASGGFPDQNDHGWLLGALPRVDPNGSIPDYLAWSKQDASAYGTAIATRTDEFRNFVTAAGEIGCGLEMAMESWYRFLVDPTPPVNVVQSGGGYVSRDLGPKGIGDETILALRKSFLRSDSLVAVVMLQDENDCSLKDSRSYSWVPATSQGNFRMWRASSQCAANPNDECCFSCMMVGVDGSIPQKCLEADPTCKQDAGSKMALDADQTGLRCKDMKRRFGFDFLFPITRYSNALTKPELCPDQTYGDLDCDCTAAKAKAKLLGYPVACEPGTSVKNPLYENLDTTVLPTGPDRADYSAVFFAGIVGVPWQDLAQDAVIAGTKPELAYKSASELNWDLFAPKDDVTAPLDPFMVESKDPRTGTHPITGEALAPPTSGRDGNSINGHEWNTDNSDLQYACTFSLEQKITEGTADATRSCADVATYCAGAADLVKCTRQFVGCSCSKAADPAAYTQNSPLCQQADGSYSAKQVSAKAYPGVRQLQALRAFHEQTGLSNNAIVASICPKDLTFANQNGGGYGYNPAVAALVDRLKEKLGGTCLPRPLTVDKATGEVPCSIVEVIQKTAGNAPWCDCAANQRDVVSSDMEKAISGALKRQSICGGSGQAPCSDFCFCGLNELTASSQAGVECLTQANVEKNASAPGYCYVDPSQTNDANLKAGEETIVAGCPASQKRLIRVVGGDGVTVPAAPAPGLVFIACSGSTYTAD